MFPFVSSKILIRLALPCELLSLITEATITVDFW
jgi:hypothetical protein